MKLQELIDQYVAFRKSMGEDFESAESLLNTFCRRMGVEIDLRNVRAKQVQGFLTGTGPITRYWRRKYDALRGLYRYATSRGLVVDTPLPISVPKLPERFVPYIYTRDELRRLLDSTAFFPKYPRKLQAHTLRAILLLLYGAGLRVSEAVALTLEDVDLSNAVITIRDNTIRAWLGHVSINTTNIYTETDLEMKAEALARCEVKETKRKRRWAQDAGLMTFLRSL